MGTLFSHVGTIRQTTYQCQSFPRLGVKSLSISCRQEWVPELPSQSRDRQAIHHRQQSTGPSPASPTVPHTCTYWPMGSSSCSKPLLLFSVVLCVAPLPRLILRHRTPDLEQKVGQDLVVVTMGLVERCPPGRYPGHRYRQSHHLIVRGSSRQKDQYVVRSLRASPVSRYTIYVE